QGEQRACTELGEDLHLHLRLPAGAQKKDGPRAGVTMTCAFVSLLTKKHMHFYSTCWRVIFH
ncbi:hypothetical protein BDZ97DRAFT_2001707, partial [Flammula alnicola]